MWNEPPLFFDDENEQELLDEFIKMSALYPNRDMFDIAAYVFRNQRDPTLRSAQAAICWKKDLAVEERIRNYIAEQVAKEAALTKEQLQAKILATTESTILAASEKKTRIEGYMSIARLNGWEVKAVEQTNKEKRIPPQVVLAIGDFAHAPE